MVDNFNSNSDSIIGDNIPLGTTGGGDTNYGEDVGILEYKKGGKMKRKHRVKRR